MNRASNVIDVQPAASRVARLHWGCGSNPMPGWINWDYAREVLERAGFRDLRRCVFGQTASRYPDIVSLDNRERESLFVEATA